MGDSIFIFLMITTSILLFWFGYYLFYGPPSPFYPYMPWNKKKVLTGKPGEAQVCPICSMALLKGDLIKTTAFAAGTHSTDRVMHIKGCYSCLENDLPRKCPVCRIKMSADDILISRLFERRFEKNHVHILGCNHCRKPRAKIL